MGGGFRSTHQQRVLLSLKRSMLPSCLYSGKWLAQRNHGITGTFSKELLCLTKPFQGAAKANGLIFCKMNLTYLLNYIPDLFSRASEDKIGLWVTSQVRKVWKGLLISTEFTTLSQLCRTPSPTISALVQTAALVSKSILHWRNPCTLYSYNNSFNSHNSYNNTPLSFINTNSERNTTYVVDCVESTLENLFIILCLWFASFSNNV